MLRNSSLLSKKITICLLCGSLIFSSAIAATPQKINQPTFKTYLNDKKSKYSIKYFYVKKNNHLYINSKGLKSLHLPMNTKMIIRNKEKYYLLNNIPGISFFIDNDSNTVYINSKKTKIISKKIDDIKNEQPINNLLKLREEILFKSETNNSEDQNSISTKTLELIPQKPSKIIDEEKTTISLPEKEVLLLETTINNGKIKKSLSYLISRKTNKLYISERDIDKINLSKNTESIIHNDERFFLISKTNKNSYSINEKEQSISLTIDISKFEKTILEAKNGKNSRNLEIEKHLNNKKVYSTNGYFLNYDLHMQKSPNFSNLSGLISGNYFNKHGEGEYSVVARKNISINDTTNQSNKTSEMIRLNTSWTKHDIDDNKTYKFGDFSTTQSSIGRNIFLGGFSISKNYTLNPNFNKISTPTIKGYSSTPSIVDVYLANSSKYSFSVPPGEFDINNMPTINGNGQAKIVIKDMLGREVSYQQDFFTNSKILKKDVDDYSISVGFERFNYGTESNDYRDLALVGNYSKGYTENLTNEYRGEFKKGYFGAGLSSNYKFEQYSTVISGRGWINKNNSNIGTSYGVSSQTTIGAMNYRFNYDKFNENYYQLGMIEYTDSYLNDRKSLFSATIGVDGKKLTQKNIGNFNLSYIQNNTFSGENSKILGLNYSKSINKNLNLNLNYLKNLNDSKKDMIFFGLTYNLDGLIANYTNTKSDGDSAHNISIQKSADDFSPISVGYGIQTQSDSNYKLKTEVKTNKGNIDGDIYSLNGNNGFNLNARGGAVIIDGNIIPTKKINNSFGIVTTKGYSDIPVYHQNKLIGKTDSNGTIILPNLSPNTENKIDVTKELPITIEAVEQPSIYPSIGKRGYFSEINLREKKSFTVNAINLSKEEIPAGSSATTYDANGNIVEQDITVGHNGLIYANYSYMIKNIVVEYTKNGKEKRCSIPINIHQQMNDLTELKERTCK